VRREVWLQRVGDESKEGRQQTQPFVRPSKDEDAEHDTQQDDHEARRVEQAIRIVLQVQRAMRELKEPAQHPIADGLLVDA
jgi:hypothetical protein